jgi:hypothetical protein
MTGEVKLIDLMVGQNLVLIQLEEKLHVSIGDLTENGKERNPGARRGSPPLGSDSLGPLTANHPNMASAAPREVVG